MGYSSFLCKTNSDDFYQEDALCCLDGGRIFPFCWWMLFSVDDIKIVTYSAKYLVEEQYGLEPGDEDYLSEIAKAEKDPMRRYFLVTSRKSAVERIKKRRKTIYSFIPKRYWDNIDKFLLGVKKSKAEYIRMDQDYFDYEGEDSIADIKHILTGFKNQQPLDKSKKEEKKGWLAKIFGLGSGDGLEVGVKTAMNWAHVTDSNPSEEEALNYEFYYAGFHPMDSDSECCLKS